MRVEIPSMDDSEFSAEVDAIRRRRNDSLLLAAGSVLVAWSLYSGWCLVSYRFVMVVFGIFLVIPIYGVALVACLFRLRRPRLVEAFFLISLLAPLGALCLNDLFVSRMVASVGPSEILAGARALVAQEVATRATEERAAHESGWLQIAPEDPRVPESLARLGPASLKVSDGYVYVRKDGAFGDYTGFKISASPNIAPGPVSWTSEASLVPRQEGSSVTTYSRTLAPGIAWIDESSP